MIPMINAAAAASLKTDIERLVAGAGVTTSDEVVDLEDALGVVDEHTILDGKPAQHAMLTAGLTELYIRKNADYGDSFGQSFKKYGLTMAAIRLEDKLNRFSQLISHEAQVKDESIRDTLLDLANYAVMTVLEMDGSGRK